MKRALISDIHANMEALECVLEDIQQQGITTITCLGDIVGHGPNPGECLDVVMERCPTTILGNHDQASMFDPDGFNPVALQAIYWTRETLESLGSAADSDRRFDFLGSLPRFVRESPYLFVHGSPREPTNEYVFPEDVYNQRKMGAQFDRIELFCFQGHTHIPGVFSSSGEFITPDECEYVYTLGEEKTIINVGSVGQPRDGDPRACYAILDEEESGRRQVEFRRVEYPFEVTIEKIYRVPSLGNMLGDRLRGGR